MNKIETLFFFTISFPSEEGETFIQNEFPYLQQAFKRIIIITSSNKKESHNLPSHVTVYSLNDILKGKTKAFFFFSNFFLALKILSGELRNCSSKKFFVKNLRSYNSTLINSFICADFIVSLNEFHPEAVYYSFWMNNHALTLSVLKMKNKIKRFVFRVHGYDLILERWPYKYIAFQDTCYRYVSQIYTVSKKSLQYLQQTYKTKKGDFAYLGTHDNGVNPVEIKDEITILSCSNIIPLKRLHLICEILAAVDVKTSWIHFGDGFLKKEILLLAKELPAHVRVEFKGKVSQAELFNYYRKNHIDFFINVSDSEGLPFSIIEACSFGIPIIATDAGGTSEIVNDQTGILLPINFDVKKVAGFLNQYQQSPYSLRAFRHNVRQFWQDNFFAGKVYPSFVEKINSCYYKS